MVTIRWATCHVRNFANQALEVSPVNSNILALFAELKACSSSRDLGKGKAVHASAVRAGEDSNIFVANTLMSMYAKCGSLVNAQRIFDSMENHEVASWNILILGFADNGKADMGLRLFSGMEAEGLTPDNRTYVAALKACAHMARNEKGIQVDGKKLVKMDSLRKGRMIHCRAAESQTTRLDMFIWNVLVDMYAKCGSMDEARTVFDRMPSHNTVSGTALMMGYVDNGDAEVALQLFSALQPQPNALTFVAAMKACSSLAMKEQAMELDGKLVKLESLKKGMAVHGQAENAGFEAEVMVANTLVDMYAKCGSLVDARRIFEGVLSRKNDNVVSWNVLILGYVENGEAETALELYSRMRATKICQPDARTIVAVLKACTSLAAKSDHRRQKILSTGRELEDQAARNGFDSDVFVASALVDMFAKCGSMVDAERVSQKMLERDVVAWTALVVGYAQNGQAELALKTLSRMRTQGCAPNVRTLVAALQACTDLAARVQNLDPENRLLKVSILEKGMALHAEGQKLGCERDIYFANTLIDFYAKCGSMENSQRVFDSMELPDVVSWTALILGYAENGEEERALDLFSSMKGCQPNNLTLAAVLKACGGLVVLELVKEVHAEVCKRGTEAEPALATSLVDAYGKCGNLFNAQHLFDSLLSRDLVAWTALIAGYSRQGDTQQVFELFAEMVDQGQRANAVTFLCVLTACSHAGLVDKGRRYFDAMRLRYGLSPGREHYVCMIDLLGRSNRLEDAVGMLLKMPFEANAVAWRTVLGACRKWKNVGIGRMAFEQVMRIDQGDGAAYMLMANSYAATGMHEEREKLLEAARIRRSDVFESCETNLKMID